jgi:hypothetical protein
MYFPGDSGLYRDDEGSLVLHFLSFNGIHAMGFPGRTWPGAHRPAYFLPGRETARYTVPRWIPPNRSTFPT